MSVSVIEKRRVLAHAEDASIVLWLLKRKRWKYKSVHRSRRLGGLGKPRNLLICVSIYLYLCDAARGRSSFGLRVGVAQAASVALRVCGQDFT